MRRHSALIAAALLALTACAETRPFAAVRLGLGQADAQGAAALTVSLDAATLARLTSDRQLQSTVADIQYVTVIASPKGFADVAQTLQKAQLAGGVGSVTFSNLPAVATTVRIVAFDAGSKQIGAGSQVVNVAAGAPTVVNFSIPLDPTYIQSVGSINGTIGFQDGPIIVGTPPPGAVVPTGTVLQTIKVTNPQAVGFDATGSAWVMSYTTDKILRYDVSGALIATIADPFSAPATASKPAAVAFDPLGNAWVANFQGGTVSSFSQANKLLASVPVGLYPTAVAFDGLGNLWVANYFGNNVVKINVATGKPAGAFPVGTNPIGLVIDSTNNVYVLNLKSQDIRKLSNAGAPLGTFKVGLAPEAIALDTGNNLWVANGGANTVMKLSTTGTLAGTFKVGRQPNGLAVDHAGNIWVANTLDSSVTKLSSTGAVLKTFLPGGIPRYVAVDKGGSIWIVEYDSGQILKLAP